jgi:hypothetical protein
VPSKAPDKINPNALGDRHFGFLGDTGSYYFLHVVGEKVPSHDEWMASR